VDRRVPAWFQVNTLWKPLVKQDVEAPPLIESSFKLFGKSTGSELKAISTGCGVPLHLCCSSITCPKHYCDDFNHWQRTGCDAFSRKPSNRNYVGTLSTFADSGGVLP